MSEPARSAEIIGQKPRRMCSSARTMGMARATVAGPRKKVDELGAGKVVLVGEVEEAEGDADDHDRDEDGVGEGIAETLLDLDAKEIRAKGENDGEEREPAGRREEGGSSSS